MKSRNFAKPRYWIVLHSLIMCAVLVSLFTGARIGILSYDFLKFFSPILPQGAIHSLHIGSGLIVTLVSLTYLFILLVKQFRRTIKTEKSRPPKNDSVSKNGTANKFTATIYYKWISYFGYVVTLSAIFSGWLYHFDLMSLGALHGYFALMMLGYLVLHGWVYFVQFGTRIFKRLFYSPFFNGWQLLIISFALFLSFGAYWQFWKPPFQHQLQVKHIPLVTFIDIDGKLTESVWSNTAAMKVMTYGGVNFPNGQTQVEIRAVENGQEIYLAYRWQDPTKSLKHLPLIKGKQGWKVSENGFYQFDEQTHYEDKFAVMLSKGCGVAGDNSTYLGKKPITGKPENWHGKGYHYTKDGSVRDIWHWKAVRTNDMYQADDNYFSYAEKPSTAARRYTAGYRPDAKESGAYVMNWQWYSPHSITPKRLPKREKLLLAYQGESEYSQADWVISWFDYQPYKPELDTYPVGTVMPSVMYRSNRFEGDRAHVRAHATWKRGVWTLEMVRALDTGSPMDVAVKHNHCMWVSAFNASQVAHSRHHAPIRIKFEKESS